MYQVISILQIIIFFYIIGNAIAMHSTRIVLMATVTSISIAAIVMILEIDLFREPDSRKFLTFVKTVDPIMLVNFSNEFPNLYIGYHFQILSGMFYQFIGDWTFITLPTLSLVAGIGYFVNSALLLSRKKVFYLRYVIFCLALIFPLILYSMFNFLRESLLFLYVCFMASCFLEKNRDEGYWNFRLHYLSPKITLAFIGIVGIHAGFAVILLSSLLLWLSLQILGTRKCNLIDLGVILAAFFGIAGLYFEVMWIPYIDMVTTETRRMPDELFSGRTSILFSSNGALEFVASKIYLLFGVHEKMKLLDFLVVGYFLAILGVSLLAGMLGILKTNKLIVFFALHIFTAFLVFVIFGNNVATLVRHTLKFYPLFILLLGWIIFDTRFSFEQGRWFNSARVGKVFDGN